MISHLTSEAEGARKKIEEWERGIQERELMEKRRVAPGWLDTGVTLLEPVRVGEDGKDEKGKGKEMEREVGEGKVLGVGGGMEKGRPAASPGEELDRAFGSLGFGK